MSRFGLKQILVLAMVIALLPVAVTAIVLSNSARGYAEELIAKRLTASALSTAYAHRETFSLARTMLTSYARNADVRAGGAECTAAFKRGIIAATGLINFARADADGLVKCAALPFTAPLSVAGEPFWGEAKTSGRFTLSPLTMGPMTRRKVFIAGIPLKRADGAFDGVLFAAIDASWLEQSLMKERLSKSAVVGIVDGDGRPVMTGGPIAIPVLGPARAGQAVATVPMPDGRDWLYARSHLFRDQLSVVYAEPKAPLFAPVWEHFGLSLLLPVLALALTIIALVAALHFFLGRWMTRLEQYTARLSAGDYAHDARNFRAAPQEIAGLAENLFTMANVIAAREKENREMVREVNHRVKNNLQMIASLLELQAGQITDAVSRQALDQTRLRVAAIAQVHRLLYEFDGGSEGGVVDMDRLVGELCGQVRSSFFGDEFNIKCHSETGSVSLDAAMPITLFIVETLSDIYRSLAETAGRGDVSLKLQRREDIAELTIASDAMIRPVQEAETIGQLLMLGYASQVQGELTIKAENDLCVVTLRFPAAVLDLR